MRINNLVADLKSLGETVEETRVVKKFLHVVPARLTPVVVSIEMFCDLKTMTVEELVGRLRAAEDRMEAKMDPVTDKMGRLLLAEEDWMAKHKIKPQSLLSKEGSSGGGGGGQYKGKSPMKREGAAADGGQGTVKLTSEGTPGGKAGAMNLRHLRHWAKTVRSPRRRGKPRRRRRRTWAVVDAR
ncbi:unnamed protein product [Miscanthus lutarioriparius]|uniref:Uncharacterized protein n=1 Tax=Miscanthus lutarioriparius TaxID=422564 RepID=A0A811PCH5_9POAL|nr:unnamed protein product [Miscanthus lutarioriparius]